MAVDNERSTSSRQASRRRSSNSASTASGSRGASRARKTNRSSQSTGGARKTSAKARKTGDKASSSTAKSANAKSGSRSRAASAGTSRTRAASARGARSKASSERTPAAPSQDETSAGRRRNGSGSVSRVGIPLATAALGAAGGVLLSRTKVQRQRKVLGVPIPNTKIDLHDLAEQVGEAGRQFGKLAREVRAVREKAERLGRAVG
jgi:hypothetical protein